MLCFIPRNRRGLRFHSESTDLTSSLLSLLNEGLILQYNLFHVKRYDVLLSVIRSCIKKAERPLAGRRSAQVCLNWFWSLTGVLNPVKGLFLSEAFLGPARPRRVGILQGYFLVGDLRLVHLAESLLTARDRRVHLGRHEVVRVGL